MFPVIDIDGYPTEETVEFLSKHSNFKDEKEAMQFALNCFKKLCYAYVKRENNYIYIGTCGWGGCEDIIRAMKENIWFLFLEIVSTRGGGHYFVDPFVDSSVKFTDFKVTVTYKG
jgi:hypothetical protein